MSWDIDNLRKIAGLNESYGSTARILTESYDDDDEDPDVARAEKEAAKRKIKLPDAGKIDPEKDLRNLAAKRKAKEEAKEASEEASEKADAEESKKAKEKEAAEHAPEKETAHEKKESPEKEKAEHDGKKPSAAEEKKETPAEEKKEEAKVAEAKRRGKAPNASSKRQRLHAHIKANPGEKRAVLLKWAAENLEMGTAYASQQIQAVKSQIKNEGYILRRPSMPKFVLHENSAMGMYQWVSESDEHLEPLMLATESEAKKVADYLISFKNQLADIHRIDLNADE